MNKEIYIIPNCNIFKINKSSKGIYITNQIQRNFRIDENDKFYIILDNNIIILTKDYSGLYNATARKCIKNRGLIITIPNYISRLLDKKQTIIFKEQVNYDK